MVDTVEKRASPRVSFPTEIWIGQDGIFTRTPRMLRDLSQTGAFIETDEGFPIGSILHLRFKLPNANALISCSVAVRNLRGDTGLGVQFLDISPDDRRRIGAFVEEALKGPEPWDR